MLDGRLELRARARPVLNPRPGEAIDESFSPRAARGLRGLWWELAPFSYTPPFPLNPQRIEQSHQSHHTVLSFPQPVSFKSRHSPPLGSFTGEATISRSLLARIEHQLNVKFKGPRPGTKKKHRRKPCTLSRRNMRSMRPSLLASGAACVSAAPPRKPLPRPPSRLASRGLGPMPLSRLRVTCAYLSTSSEVRVRSRG